MVACRKIEAVTVDEKVLSTSGDDTWVVSLDLAATNWRVQEALHPARARWDAVIFDEAHRLTPTASARSQFAAELSRSVKHALFLTATPHRGKETYFRYLLHLVDPDVFPPVVDDGNGWPSSVQERTPGAKKGV